MNGLGKGKGKGAAHAFKSQGKPDADMGICIVHGKRRGLKFLEDTDDGYVCKLGSECKDNITEKWSSGTYKEDADWVRQRGMEEGWPEGDRRWDQPAKGKGKLAWQAKMASHILDQIPSCV